MAGGGIAGGSGGLLRRLGGSGRDPQKKGSKKILNHFQFVPTFKPSAGPKGARARGGGWGVRPPPPPGGGHREPEGGSWDRQRGGVPGGVRGATSKEGGQRVLVKWSVG